MLYHQQVRGIRPDVTVINPFFFETFANQQELIRQQREHLIYITEEIDGDFQFRPISDYFAIGH